MKLFLKINWILTILLSLSTGIFKILQQEADIELFQAIGFSYIGTTILGVIQLIGGVLIIIKKLRKFGALTLVLTFIIASTAVFANQMYLFGFVSLLFIGMGLLVYFMDSLSNTNLKN